MYTWAETFRAYKMLENNVISMTFIIFVLGTILGSFTSCLAIRRTRGESIIYPASHCDTCSRKLKLGELIPILSYLKSRGRCTCGARIGTDKILSEVFSGVIFILLFQKYGWGIELFFFILLSLLLIEISVVDFLTLAAYEEDLIVLMLIGLAKQIHNFYTGRFYISIAITQVIFLFMYFYISKKEFTAIGEGDLIMFGSLIAFFSPIQAFYFFAYSSWIALLPALYYWKKGDRKIPMLPFISLSFIICIIRWV